MIGASLAVASLAFSAAAFADIPGPLVAALKKTTEANSYHITISSAHMNSTGDVVRGGDMDMQMSNGMESLVVNKTMYMKMHGKWTKLGAMDVASIEKDAVKEYLTRHADFSGSDLGMRNIGGAALHAYSATDGKTHHTTTVYVDDSGYATRFEGRDGLIMTVSNFGEPVHLHAPI